MTPVLMHAAAEVHSSIGSPLYRVIPQHVPGLVAGLLLPGALWFLLRRGNPRQLRADERFAAWLLLVSAAVHAGLVVGEERLVLELLFALDAVALVAVTRRLLRGRAWRLPAALLLSGSIVAYAVAVVADEPPDQVGLATKLVELAALGVVLTPRRATRPRRLAASSATVSLVVLTGLAAWVGAFAAADRSGGGHHGPMPMPGTILPPTEERSPTRRERVAARRFYAHASRALRRYRNTAVAAADGYQVNGIVGNDFHAANSRYASDGRIFDPARPESLVYARAAGRPVLLGAVYEMPDFGRSGPAIGGPLTPWHAHENICFSLVPPALSGLVSPFGGCPVGSVAIPITPEMIHVWVVPGAPSRFGDLDDAWRASYLRSLES